MALPKRRAPAQWLAAVARGEMPKRQAVGAQRYRHGSVHNRYASGTGAVIRRYHVCRGGGQQMPTRATLSWRWREWWCVCHAVDNPAAHGARGMSPAHDQKGEFTGVGLRW